MKDIYLKGMEIQWKDHFHMRDQTWKTLQFTIAIFLGVVGLIFKGGIDPKILFVAKFALLVTSVCGLLVEVHHRKSQKLKFELIKLYEEKLDLKPMISPTIKRYNSCFTKLINTSIFIFVGQFSMVFVAIFMLCGYSS